MMTKKRNGKRKQYSRMGRASAQKLTAEQRIARAAHAAEARYRPMHDERLLMYREGKLVGVLDVSTATLNSDDADLQALYRQACDPGVFSLGDINAPQPEDGTIVDHALWTRLLPGSLEGMYAFKRELEGKGFRAEVTKPIQPKANINPKFVATHCYLTPRTEPGKVEAKITGKPGKKN